jgi:acyl-[acyl-carrier-protein] desaturase
MYDGQDPDLFDHFSAVEQRTGVYTAIDYAAILEHLVETWKIADLSVSGNAASAQRYLCSQAEKYRRIADRYMDTIEQQPRVKFSWIHDREA